ncbi:MAG: DUF58 domain-containing protein [Eubacteriales bacterium]|nr:DUF58 domain-containing protein [Eubacteriales bacterium]
MSIRPRFFYYLLFCLSAWFLGHFGNWVWSNTLFVFLLLLPVGSLLAAFWHRSRIQLKLESLADQVERASVASWQIRMSSRSVWQKHYIQGVYSDQAGSVPEYLRPFPLKPREFLDLVIEMNAPHTGPLKPYAFALSLIDPCGFFALKLVSFQAEDFPEVLVLPRSLISILDKDESKAYLETGEAISQKSGFDLDEIELVRPMREGDRMRDVHWKVSARMQDWMVRQYEKADENELYFLFQLPDLDPSQAMSEDKLNVRDLVLDQVSEAAQSFLSQDFSLLMRYRRPWADEHKADSLDLYDSLRWSLASLPYRQPISLAQQVSEEAAIPGARFYLIFCYMLSQELTTSLLVLSAQAQGILLRLIYPGPTPPKAWKAWIEDLSAAGVKVTLSRFPGILQAQGRELR